MCIASVTLNKNDMCDWYHTGAFGKVNARWSCCLAEKRESKGCRRTTNTQRSRPASLSTQWEHVSSTEEQDSKDDPLSESVPSGHSATCNWGDEEVQNEMYDVLVCVCVLVCVFVCLCGGGEGV